MRYFVKTFGCQMNKGDSGRIAALLEEQGYRPAPAPEEADLLVVNTCSVRQASEDKVYGLASKINELRATNKGLQVILTGCMVGSARGERKRTSLGGLKAKLPWVDEFKTLGEWLRAEDLRTLPPARSAAGGARRDKAGEKAFVSIMEGCDHFCSYCVVPYARGPERSRPLREVLREVKELVGRGVEEVTLLGQNVNSYRPGFAKLLTVLNGVGGLKKIGFLTSNPWDLTDEIIDAVLLPKVDRYIHLPVQSGDDEVLRRMNRPYTALQYIGLVGKIRKKIPGVRVGTDIIVGFSGETREQFENTVRLCEKVKFDAAYVAKYSPRLGTAAAEFPDDVPLAEKRRRHAVLLKLLKTP